MAENKSPTAGQARPLAGKGGRRIMPDLETAPAAIRPVHAASGSQSPETASPEQGPRLLFFSGGTALKDTARALTEYTHNSIHLITPFDSGGSSAALRKAFAMPAVGDLRSRMTALADTRHPGNPELYRLFAYRLPENASPELLRHELESLAHGLHPLLRRIPLPMSETVREHILGFIRAMPEDFPLAGANIGNLALAAGYLRHNRRLRRAVALYARMMRVRGLVLPTVDDTAHLAVRLKNGNILVGQHRFTGKTQERISSPIEELWLTPAEDCADRLQLAIDQRTAELIRGADAICYPVGSFYSSVVANLLPKGVGRAIAANPGIKIFVPNLGMDPELAGHSLTMQIERLLRPLLADAPQAKPGDFLSLVLVDAKKGAYPGPLPKAWLRAQGIGLAKMPLVCEGPLAAPRLLASALMRLMGK